MRDIIMKNITSLKTLFLVMIASNSFAMGTVAETNMEKRLAENPIVYKPSGTYNAHINKRTSLGEYIPLNKGSVKATKEKSTPLPVNYHAVMNKRLQLSENYPR